MNSFASKLVDSRNLSLQHCASFNDFDLYFELQNIEKNKHFCFYFLTDFQSVETKFCGLLSSVWLVNILPNSFTD